MGSHATLRDFQWTNYEKPHAPPPLPSLPPWAAQAQLPTAAASATVGQTQLPTDAGGVWRRPTSYFGAMKRLPTLAPQEQVDDADDRERHHDHMRESHPPVKQESYQQNEDDRGRREWLYGNRSVDFDPAKDTPNQGEDATTRTPMPPPTSPPKAGQPESSSSSPMVKPLATDDAFFRPWKHTSSSSNNNNNDSDGGDDGEASVVNKWKERALLNPFAKKKAATKPSPKTNDPEHAHDDDCNKSTRDDGEEPAVASPPAVRSAVPRTPPPPRRLSVAVKRAESAPAPHDSLQVCVPQRPRTPILTPAPLAMLSESPLSQPQPWPPRGSVRSREAGSLPHLPPAPAPASDRPRFEDNADLPAALMHVTDLRKSTAQLAPLEPTTDRGRVAITRESPVVRNEMEMDDEDDSVRHVLKRVPPKPPTQLQQLQQQHQQHKQKAKKGATLDALSAIQRKREQRRSAQAEEKQRLKAEVAQHGDDAGYKFRRLIQRYRDALPPSQRGTPVGGAAPSSQRLCVFVRKRPLAKKELKAKGYDILTCLYAAQHKGLDTTRRRELLCHEPKLKVDCSEALENHAFSFDGVFDDDQDNETIYTATVGPLVPSLVPSSSGTTAASATSLTVFAYGQTGSGKTFTMKSIYRQAATDLFARLAASRVRVAVGVSFYEIYMNHVNDLLNLRTRVQLMEDGDGVVQLLGLKEVAIASADELMELIRIGEDSRATSANAVHDDSSRSHALLRVTIASADTGTVLARLSMVDLAGSERACDTQSDAKSTRMEGAEINKSLLALKECVRALDRGATHIPFRQSKLTQLLRDSFLCANSKTVMIATVSPCSVSCNHTLNTLRYADRLKEIGAN